MDDWNWDANHLVNDNICNIVNIQCPNMFLQGMTNNVRFPCNVNNTTRMIYNEYWAIQIELVTLNTTINVESLLPWWMSYINVMNPKPTKGLKHVRPSNHSYPQKFKLKAEVGFKVCFTLFTERRLIHYNRPLRLGHCKLVTKSMHK